MLSLKSQPDDFVSRPRPSLGHPRKRVFILLHDLSNRKMNFFIKNTEVIRNNLCISKLCKSQRITSMSHCKRDISGQGWAKTEFYHLKFAIASLRLVVCEQRAPGELKMGLLLEWFHQQKHQYCHENSEKSFKKKVFTTSLTA